MTTAPPDSLAAAHEDWSALAEPPPDPLVVQHRKEQPNCHACDELPPNQMSDYCRKVVTCRAAFAAAASAVRSSVAAQVAAISGCRVSWHEGKGIVVHGRGWSGQVAARVTLYGSAWLDTYNPAKDKLVVAVGTARYYRHGRDQLPTFRQPKAGFDFAKIAQAALGRLWQEWVRQGEDAEREARLAACAAETDALQAALRVYLPGVTVRVTSGYPGGRSVELCGLSEDTLGQLSQALVAGLEARRG